MAEEIMAGRLSRHLLYEDAADAIRKLIAEKGLWGNYLIPERELARMLGINRGTVRKSLDLLLSEGLIARRHGQGTWVKAQPKQRVPLQGARVAVASLWSHTSGGYVSRIMSGLTAGASDAGWNVNFFGSLHRPANRDALLMALRRRELDGLLLFTITRREQVEEVLAAWDGPAVMVDHHFPDLPLTCVLDDSEGGARRVVEHFLALGHRRIAYVDVPNRDRNPWRYAGYIGALRDAGLELDDGLIGKCSINLEKVRVVGGQMLERPDPPTAILAFDDVVAWGIWQAAEARGLKVGRDLALAGYGDIAAGAGFSDELTSVRVDMNRLGEVAAAELDDLMAGRSQPGRLVLAPAELMVRASSGEARRKDT